MSEHRGPWKGEGPQTPSRSSKLATSVALLSALWVATYEAPSFARSADGSADAPAGKVSARLEALPAFRIQVWLDRAAFSPGAIDGLWGSNTERALRAYQESRGLEATATADPATLVALGAADTPVLARYTITRDDLDGPFVRSIPEDLEDQAGLDALLYTSASEALAERFHTLPEVLKRLNPDTKLKVGRKILVPAVVARRTEAGDSVKAARIVVSKSRLALTVENERDEVVFYAPVTAGSEHDPLPVGDWKVTSVARDPVFHYNPDLFWDAEPRDDAAVIAAGPNNPVGSVWIGLDKEHYGIHGTPEPSQIGHVLSHGCVRLTNWDALEVAAWVRQGTPVAFRE